MAVSAGFGPEVIFVSRALEAAPEGAERTGAITRAARGSLLLVTVGLGVTTLVDASDAKPGENVPVDVMEPDVSPDGARVVFSGFREEEGAWRIFEVMGSRSPAHRR